MTLSHELSEFLPWVVAVGVSFVAWKVGRRWRRQFQGAVALRAHLENTVETQAEALSAMQAQLTATASGNVVVIGRDDLPAGLLGQLHAGPGAHGGVGAGSAGAVLPRADSRPDLRSELGLDYLGVPDYVGRKSRSGSHRQLVAGVDSDAGSEHGGGVRSDDD